MSRWLSNNDVDQLKEVVERTRGMQSKRSIPYGSNRAPIGMLGRLEAEIKKDGYGDVFILGGQGHQLATSQTKQVTVFNMMGVDLAKDQVVCMIPIDSIDSFGLWVIIAAGTPKVDDEESPENPLAGENCICDLIELLHCKDHLSDITEQEWEEIYEKCNCPGAPAEACGFCQEDTTPAECTVEISGVTAVAPVVQQAISLEGWQAVADRINGSHTCKQTITQPTCDWEVEHQVTDPVTDELIRVNVRWNTWNFGRRVYVTADSDNLITASSWQGSANDSTPMDCQEVTEGYTTVVEQISATEGGVEFSNQTTKTTPKGSGSLPPCENENERQPAGSTVHYVGKIEDVPQPATQQVERFLKNQMVTEHSYTGIANKNTSDNLAPRPVGESFLIRDSIGTWPDPAPEQNTTSQLLVVGHRYTWQEDGGILATQLYIPDDMVDRDVEVWLIRNPLTLPDYQVLVPSFTIAPEDTDRWIEIPRGLITAREGNQADLVARFASRNSPQSFTYDWTYNHSNGDPASGNINQQNNNHADLRVHQNDDLGIDRSTELDNITPGGQISIAGLTWDVVNVSKAGSVYYFTVEPAVRGTSGLQPITFRWYGALPMHYVEVASYYSTAPGVQGLLSVGEYDPGTITPNDNGYGVDQRVQQLLISDDWDIISTQ